MSEHTKLTIHPEYAAWYKGRTALVTGATAGIGKAIARLLASYGAKVLLCGRNHEAMETILQDLKSISSQPNHGYFADLASKESISKLIQDIQKEHRIDILINNAGFGYMGDFQFMPEDLSFSMQEVNITAVTMLTHAFIPRMKGNNTSGILNVGSVASFFPTPHSALYGATKHFIVGLTDALHQEMLTRGIHVTGLYPGKTHSRFLERSTAGRITEWDNGAMDPEVVAQIGLKGLFENRIRVIPGFSNRLKIFVASLMPISMLLKNTYERSPRFSGAKEQPQGVK